MLFVPHSSSAGEESQPSQQSGGFMASKISRGTRTRTDPIEEATQQQQAQATQQAQEAENNEEPAQAQILQLISKDHGLPNIPALIASIFLSRSSSGNNVPAGGIPSVSPSPSEPPSTPFLPGGNVCWASFLISLFAIGFGISALHAQILVARRLAADKKKVLETADLGALWDELDHDTEDVVDEDVVDGGGKILKGGEATDGSTCASTPLENRDNHWKQATSDLVSFQDGGSDTFDSAAFASCRGSDATTASVYSRTSVAAGDHLHRVGASFASSSNSTGLLGSRTSGHAPSPSTSSTARFGNNLSVKEVVNARSRVKPGKLGSLCLPQRSTPVTASSSSRSPQLAIVEKRVRQAIFCSQQDRNYMPLRDFDIERIARVMQMIQAECKRSKALGLADVGLADADEQQPEKDFCLSSRDVQEQIVKVFGSLELFLLRHVLQNETREPDMIFEKIKAMVYWRKYSLPKLIDDKGVLVLKDLLVNRWTPTIGLQPFIQAGPWIADDGYPIEAWDCRYLQSRECLSVYSQEQICSAALHWFRTRCENLKRLKAPAPYVIFNMRDFSVTNVFQQARYHKQIVDIALPLAEHFPHTHLRAIFADTPAWLKRLWPLATKIVNPPENSVEMTELNVYQIFDRLCSDKKVQKRFRREFDAHYGHIDQKKVALPV
ncbi:unnamed protein product [Amoebophrya sp. A25]|nr:unnamed protein product [Amoebophrya sp. A25]|eukprot:GSA25T00021441001.1